MYKIEDIEDKMISNYPYDIEAIKELCIEMESRCEDIMSICNNTNEIKHQLVIKEELDYILSLTK